MRQEGKIEGVHRYLSGETYNRPFSEVGGIAVRHQGPNPIPRREEAPRLGAEKGRQHSFVGSGLTVLF